MFLKRPPARSVSDHACCSQLHHSHFQLAPSLHAQLASRCPPKRCIVLFYKHHVSTISFCVHSSLPWTRARKLHRGYSISNTITMASSNFAAFKPHPHLVISFCRISTSCLITSSPSSVQHNASFFFYSLINTSTFPVPPKKGCTRVLIF